MVSFVLQKFSTEIGLLENNLVALWVLFPCESG